MQHNCITELYLFISVTMLTYVLIASLLAPIQFTTQAPSKATWKNWTFCKKSDLNGHSECLVKAINGAKKDLLDGNSYFGIPSLNPLHIDELSMYQAEQDKRAAAVNITLNNCDVYNTVNWELSNAIADWDSGELSATVHFLDTIVFNSDYTVNGKIMLLPVKGKGNCKMTFDDMVADMALKGRKVKRKDREYFTDDKMDVDIKPKRATFNFNNTLLDAAFNEGLNKLLNENWKVIIDDFKQPIGQALGATFKVLSERVFSKIPYNVLSPN